MNPQEPMMRGRAGQNEFSFAYGTIHALKAIQKTRQGASADWTMTAHCNISLSQFTGVYLNPLFGLRILDPQQIVWQ
jgi:hypothetical protein